MRLCGVLLVFSIVCATTHSKAITSDANVLKSRNLDYGECCPCPKPRGDLAEEALYPVEPVVDDCPCRNRAADSEGSSSILSPALQALRPFMRSDDPKTEPEPLLKPEVGLATSVLKTLQEATNEEYEDALARDATKSIVKALKSDLPFLQSDDTPGSIINIILNPQETGNDLEVVPEASHLQETRCIHPLGSSHNNCERNNLKSILYREPNIKSMSRGRISNARNDDYDMDNQASEIQNSLQKPSNGYAIKSLHESEENSPETRIENPKPANTLNTFSKIPDFKLSTIVDNIKKSIQSNSVLNKLTKNEDSFNIPMTTGTEEKPRKLAGTFKNFKNIINHVDKPMNLKNLLKLKDVEIIPKRTVSDHKSLHNDDSIINASDSDDEKAREQQDNTETEILDAVPSSSNKVESESTNIVSLKPQNLESNACDDINIIPSDESSETKQQILNKLDKSDLEQNEIVKEINNPSTVRNFDVSNYNSEIPFERDETTSKDEDAFKENQSIEVKQDKNILPLIRADIIKSFKSFKKVNEDMQEKLRQNLQDALKVVDTNEKKINENENSNLIERDSKKITDDDLQRMSDSILNESNMRTKKLKQANVDSELDDCVPARDNKQNVVEERTFNENSSVSKSVISDINNPTNEQHADSNKLNKSVTPSVSLNDQLNDQSNNKVSITKGDRNDNQLDQNNKNSILESPECILNENTLAKSNEDGTDSPVDVPKFSNVPQSTSNVNSDPMNRSATQEVPNDTDLKTEMSQINQKSLNPLTDKPSDSISDDERKCLDINRSNSNDMNVQASEPIGNRITFTKPDIDLLKSDRRFAPKFSLGSGLKPYSARLASPHSLDRETIHPNFSNKMNSLQSTFKNNNLKNAFKKPEMGVLPTLGSLKRNDVSILKPLDEFNSLSDNFRSRTDESLKDLNNMFGNGPVDLKANHLHKNVLNNADDIRHSLSIAHNDLNNKLQQLHSDWTDKILTIGQRADAGVPINRKNFLNSEKKIPLLSFEKPRSESSIKRVKPKTLLNDEKFKLPQLLPKSLYKPPSLGERKATFLSTTKRPLPMFTTKIPPRKEVSLKSAPKPTLSQTLKDVLGSAKSDKVNKLRDMKTLSSNIKPLRVQNKGQIARKSIAESRESLENQENIQPYKDITTENTRRDSLSRNSGSPFQLKAEEFSVLKKLLDGIRSSHYESDKLRNNNDYDDNANENLQAPSQNMETFKMPENTLKENVPYKCKMVCTKDDK